MDDGAPLLGAATSEHYKRHAEFEKWRAAVYWFSLIFLGAGIVLISLSIWASVVNPLNPLISVLPVSFIVIGVFIFLVSFLGWYSSTRESRTLMGLYIVLIVTSVLVTVALTILTFYDDKHNMATNLENAWYAEYEANPHSPILESLETDYTCCGFNDPADAPVPSNCSDILNTDVGCRESLIQLSEEVLGVVKITGLVSAFVQAVGVVFAGLAYHYAPSKAELDQLLQEEAERLNRTWTTSSREQPSTSRTQSVSGLTDSHSHR